VNLLGGYTGTVRRASRSVEIVFPARRQKSTLQSIEPPAIDGKALEGESFFPSHLEESAARCVSCLPVLSALSARRVGRAMRVLSARAMRVLSAHLPSLSARAMRVLSAPRDACPICPQKLWKQRGGPRFK
jgi:hypothetical protein